MTPPCGFIPLKSKLGVFRATLTIPLSSFDTSALLLNSLLALLPRPEPFSLCSTCNPLTFCSFKCAVPLARYIKGLGRFKKTPLSLTGCFGLLPTQVGLPTCQLPNAIHKLGYTRGFLSLAGNHRARLLRSCLFLILQQIEDHTLSLTMFRFPFSVKTGSERADALLGLAVRFGNDPPYRFAYSLGSDIPTSGISTSLVTSSKP
ncbi:hypothetical protein Hipma_0681 [Hippea maritima DSM 10411]|uniref:Uncharacterized protein n=1 Tax=Hippea maritima (strain ATCC 700847 / DSM 10411 / MH2) TaxID=760142 RepID=F2LV67_HIPMA|nr:hypothetical protein Hipma_0681 [Hippea maritima DSM 10411]